MDPKDDLDNHANQLNDNNDAYYQSRGFDDHDDYAESLDDDSSSWNDSEYD
jgi:hypothetical protein